MMACVGECALRSVRSVGALSSRRCARGLGWTEAVALLKSRREEGAATLECGMCVWGGGLTRCTTYVDVLRVVGVLRVGQLHLERRTWGDDRGSRRGEERERKWEEL